MNKELITKLIRIFTAGICFSSIIPILGMGIREAQQFIWMLGITAIFALIMRNIWVTLFLGWTVFLYSFFKFQSGLIYLTNIFYSCLFYYLIKLAFRKEHIDFYIKIVLWFVFANIILVALQIIGFDFIYTIQNLQLGKYVLSESILPTGFMGAIAFMGCLMSLAMPLLASRRSKWAIVGAFGLFLPLYLSKAMLCFLGAIIGLLFVLFFRFKRAVWIGLIIVLLIGAIFYVKYEFFEIARFKMWKKVLQYCVIHPITGWGLDSFRNFTPFKDFNFMNSFRTDGQNQEIITMNIWDNPHNLYVSLFFEFGIVGLFLLGGYLRQLCIWFRKAIKDPNVIGLAGFVLVFFINSFGHFIIFLPRFAVFVIPAFALFEVAIRE